MESYEIVQEMNAYVMKLLKKRFMAKSSRSYPFPEALHNPFDKEYRKMTRHYLQNENNATDPIKILNDFDQLNARIKDYIQTNDLYVRNLDMSLKEKEYLKLEDMKYELIQVLQ